MKNYVAMAALAAALGALSACNGSSSSSQLTKSGLDPENFVAEYNGKTTGLYTLTNEAGMEVAITNFGGRIVSLMVPDREGNLRDVVLGFDSIADYFPERNQTDFGAAIGRYGNRIDHGRLVIDGDTFQLDTNNYGHTLHGGPTGWQYQVFDAEQPNDSTLVLSIVSPDGDNGFPGTVSAIVTYTLLPDNTLDILYGATTDRPTVINMTNHSYFNLSGDATRSVEGDLLYINASGFTPVDSTFMTSGEIAPVVGTPMDFTTPTLIGAHINDTTFTQIRNGLGYDHNWVLDTNGDINTPATILNSPESGITLTIFTDEPGIQVYAGNFLDGTVIGKKGITYAKRTGMAMETQHYPDSPNKPQWPSTVLRPGTPYSSHTIWRFSTDK